jgi:sulfate adenylyltransferase subunit 2
VLKEISYLNALESESIYVIRETVAELERPALLFSGGKDSAVLLHLAYKALYPQKIPFPVCHIDTGHNFPEVIEFRDKTIAKYGVNLVVGSVQKSIDENKVVEIPGESRNRLQTSTLLETIETYGFGALLGGARRDEEKARAKERFFSHRDAFSQWDPRNQRPELWNIFNTRKFPNEHFRVFPLLNWTELDIWRYIQIESLELPSIYFAHTRRVFRQGNMLMADCPYIKSSEEVFEASVRYRTVGDMGCTAAVESTAATLEAVINEIASTRISERGQTRADDKFSEAAMEDRKKEGYF